MVTQAYPNMLASGVVTSDINAPFELLAGESKIVTEQAVAAGTIPQFSLVSLKEDGTLTVFDPASAGAASAVLNFTGTGTAADTVTINGQAITLVASGATGFQVNIGASATLTAQAVKALINANPDTFQVFAVGDGTALTLYALVPGVAGNSIAVAESGTNTNFTGGVTALAGGSAELEAKISGLAAQPATIGEGTPYYKEGFFNHEIVANWPAWADTFAKRRAFLANYSAPFNIGKLL